ncbi:MAG TPA: AMP-binding protein, partial [Burkholderiaceae bacterium]
MSAQIDRFVHEGLPPPELLPVFRYDLPELQLPDQLNLVEELLDKAAAKGFADKPMLRSPARTLTYAQAAVEVNRMAQVLTEDLGLVPGNRVLLRGGNSIPMALAWLAVVKAGLIAVATMPLLRARELGDIIDKAKPAVALCEARLIDEMLIAQQANPVLRQVIAFKTDAPDAL